MSGGKPPAGKDLESLLVWIVCKADNDMARTFEFVLHFVKCDMVTSHQTRLLLYKTSFPCRYRQKAGFAGLCPGRAGNA